MGLRKRYGTAPRAKTAAEVARAFAEEHGRRKLRDLIDRFRDDVPIEDIAGALGLTTSQVATLRRQLGDRQYVYLIRPEVEAVLGLVR